MEKLKFLTFLVIFGLFFMIKLVEVQGEQTYDWWDPFRNLQTELTRPPENLIEFLVSFGIPQEIASSWPLLFIYVVVPIATFAIVLEAVMVRTIIVEMMGFKIFRGWRGWVFVLLVILFLIPTGLVGAFAMWLYASAGILVIYGFAALLFINIVKKFVSGATSKAIVSAVLLILAVVILSFLVPGLAIFIGFIGFFLVLYPDIKTMLKPVTVASVEKTEEKAAQDLWSEWQQIVGPFVARKIIPGEYISDMTQKAMKIVENVKFGSMGIAEARREFEIMRKKLETTENERRKLYGL